MAEISSLRGRIEYFNQCIQKSTNDVDRIVFKNILNMLGELYIDYGIDVIYKIPSNKIFLNQFEKPGFAQFNEDGITEKIFETIGFTNKFYLDFGATASTNNSEVLHKNYNFTGILLNCDDTECEYTKIYTEKVDAENIVSICEKYKVPIEFDFLSIDIDGNDWYVFKAICKVYKPRVVVIEYNASFPPPEDKVVTYDANFSWECDNYHGASIQAMYNLSRTLGYSLVAAESSGYNLFFIRDDVIPASIFYGINDVKLLYRTPKIGHRPCGENGFHTDECMKTYKFDGIMGHKQHTPEKIWTSSTSKLH